MIITSIKMLLLITKWSQIEKISFYLNLSMIILFSLYLTIRNIKV